MNRKRIQIELGPADQAAFERIRGLGANDAEIGRRAIALLARLTNAIDEGFTIAAIPLEESRFVDFTPELTNAVAPERSYRHLVRVRHSWRRQLSIKGRRTTVGQLVGQMNGAGWDAERAALEFDLPLEAVIEAMDYAERYAALIAEEAAEERRCVEQAPAVRR